MCEPQVRAESAGRSRWWRGGIVLLLLGYLVWNSLYYFPCLVDDTFISLRYARNLASGAGLVYNPGQHVEGYSNFSWVIIEALLIGLNWPVITTMKLLGLASGVATAVLTFVLARRVVEREPERSLASFAALGFICLNTGVAVWSQAGLETDFFALLVVAMCLRYEVELGRTKPFPWSGVLFALAWMTRPEAPVYGIYFLVRRISLWRRCAWRAADSWWLLAVAVFVIPYELWGLWYFGRLLPHTHAAKLGTLEVGGPSGLLSRLVNPLLLRDFATNQGWGLMVLLGLGAVGCLSKIRRLAIVTWLPLACGLLFVLYAHSDWMPRHRLLVPTIPFISVLLGCGLGQLHRFVRRHPVGVLAWCVVCGFSFALCARHQMFARYPGVPPSLTHARNWGWYLDVPARLFQRHYPAEEPAWNILMRVPAGETICAHNIGFIGFLTANPIWDTAGLFIPTVARARHERSEEAQRRMCKDLLATRPGYILLKPANPARWQHNVLDRFLQTHPRAVSTYDRGLPPWRSRCVEYLRKDLRPVDSRARVRAAVRQFPEYERRAEELLEAYADNVPSEPALLDNTENTD